MKSAAFITTYIDWRKWKKWIFNIPLFIFQLIFMVIGTAYGKIKWPKRIPTWGDVFIMWLFLIPYWIIPTWWNIPVVIGWLFTVVAIFRHIDWRRVWRAAQVSHVRLCLVRLEGLYRKSKGEAEFWRYISFGWPVAKLEIWRIDQCKGRFRYFDPTFEPSPEFIEAMIQYAQDQEGKRYDWLQLILGYPANLILWIFWPPWWGKEKIRWFNLRGAEVCSSGWLACLRWAEVRQDCSDIITARVFENNTCDLPTMFFKGYDTAVVPPCLAVIDKNWREKDE